MIEADIHPLLRERLRTMSLDQRFAHGLRFLKSTRDLLLAGVRARHPVWSEQQIAAEARRLMSDGRY